MDIALIVADTLANKVESVGTSGGSSVQRMEEEVERISEEKPWYKANLQRAGELGLKAIEVLQFGIESIR